MKALLAASLLLGACAAKPNPDVCPSVPGELSSAVREKGKLDFYQQATNERVCIAKWAFKLAPATDDIRATADAVVEACGDAIDMKSAAWAQFRTENEKSAVPIEPDLKAGRDAARSLALFYVAAGRVGNCEKK